MTPREKALAIVALVAEEFGLPVEAMFERNRRPECDRARRRAYAALVRDLKWSHGQVARLFNRSRQTISEALCHPAAPPDIEDLLEDLQRQIERYTGVEIVHSLVMRLDLYPWMAAYLAVLIEAHPRPLAIDVIGELYDEAMRRLGRDAARRDDDLVQDRVKTFAYRMNRRAAEQGLPQAVRHVPPYAYALTPDFAYWLAVNMGRPFLPRAALARLAA